MVAGILGAGYGKGYRLNYSNIIDEMKEQGVINKRQFSVVLNHKDDSTGECYPRRVSFTGTDQADRSTIRQGEVIFGGIDTKKFSGKLLKAKLLKALPGDEQR